jgi:hypothetical protein
MSRANDDIVEFFFLLMADKTGAEQAHMPMIKVCLVKKFQKGTNDIL